VIDIDGIELVEGCPQIKALCKRDAALARLIRHVGEFTVPLHRDYFQSLVRSIIGQQLSVKSAQSIRTRLDALCPILTPSAIAALSDEELRSAGLSTGKIRYLNDLAERVLSGSLDLTAIEGLTDEEVMARLTEVKGIGRWTTEMFLIFSLGRQDILAYDDLGLQRAIKWLYQLKELPSKRKMEILGNHWKPYRSIASLYLWEVVDMDLIKRDPQDLLK